MSTAEADDESGARDLLRTVTPLSTERPDVQMNLFGYLVFLPILLLVLPLLPFVAVLVIGAKVAKALRGQ